MLNKLQKHLNELSSSQIAQEKLISELYKNIDQMHEKLERLQSHCFPKKNLFISVRPQVLYQILEFLDLRTQLQLRLVNKSVNKVMHKIALLKCQQLIKQVDNSVSELEELKLQESKQEIYPHLEQQLKDAQQNIIDFGMKDLVELRYFHQKFPGVILENVLRCLQIIYRTNFDGSDYIFWYKALRLISLPVESLSDQQLNKLELIDEIPKEQVRRFGKTLEKIYELLKALIYLRRTQAYFTKHKIYLIEKRIDDATFIIKQLQGNYTLF